MEIKTKFNVGEKVYVIHDISTYKKSICPTCDGEGSVMICSRLKNITEGKYPMILCPHCHGQKMITGEKVNRYTMEETTVKGIKISVTGFKVHDGTKTGITKSKVHATYRVKADNSKGECSYPEHENMIVGSYLEAIDRCEELNHRLED